MLKVHSIPFSILTWASKMPSQETFRDVQTSKAVSIGVERLKSWERKKSCVLGRKKKWVIFTCWRKQAQNAV